MQWLVELLGRPRTIKHQIHNRKVSWLELFYDLMFAVVIARLTDGLLDQLSWGGLGNSILLFAWFIWNWNEVSGYFDNHGNDAIINILIINVDMILVGIGAIFIPAAIRGFWRQIAIVFMILELLMALVWLILAHFDHVHGPASRVWGLVHLVALFIMIVANFFSSTVLLSGLILAMLLNIFDVLVTNPWLDTEYHQARMRHTISDSLIERYGLMTMIALGEVIAGLYEGLTATRATTFSLSRFVLAIILTALVAAIYYQVLGTLEIALPSSIDTSLTGWLFILGIMFSFYLGVGMQLQERFQLTPLKEFGNLSLSVCLVLFLWTIRLIVRIGTAVAQHEKQWEIGWMLMGEEVLILAASWLPSLDQLIAIDLLLLIIILQGKMMEKDHKSRNK